MGTQVNWHRIRSELQRLADTTKLKAEVHRIGEELRRFDLQAVLSPKALAKVKELEKRYADLMRRLHVAQRQVDREVNRIMKQIKTHREDAATVLTKQREKLEKVSQDFRHRFQKPKRGARTADATRSAPASAEASAGVSESATSSATVTSAPKAKRKGPGRPKSTGARSKGKV